MGRAWRGAMPARYETSRGDELIRTISDVLRPGHRVLDIGAGARPTVHPSLRPGDCTYIGLDLSLEELDRAPAGSYDEKVAIDAARPVGALEGTIDVVVCVNVLEHVADVPATLETMRSYLREGGVLVAEFAGAFSVFALLNRVLPHRAAQWLLRRLLGRRPENVFPVHYHQCWYSAVERAMAAWAKVTIEPLYRGASYFRFFRPLLALYLAFENWTARRGLKNLASHYRVVAVK